MKKILKVLGVIVVLLLVFLIAAPFLFEGKILDIVKNTVNKNINAKFDFADADVSLIRNFPNASVSVKEMSIINNAPFEGDTLVFAKEANISVPFMQLFNSEDEPYSVNSFTIDGAVVNIFIDEEGNENYNITVENETTSEEENTTETSGNETSSNVSLSIQKYQIINSRIKYYDQKGKMYFEIDELNHSGTGDLSTAVSELDTETSGLVSFQMDSVNYFSRNAVRLDAKLGVDLNENKYTFLDNKASINQLELVFDGFVKLNDNNQEVNITFETPSSDFKNFLALIPKEYSQDIADVETSGDFVVSGKLNGVVDDKHIPTFDIIISSNNASFKYPDLPQSVTNISIDTKIANETGILENTYVDLNKLTFKIAQDVFSASAHVKNLMGNALVNANLKGRINLANLSNAYPFPEGNNLKGILEANLTTAFDMEAIEKSRYEQTKNSGSLGLKDFEFSSEELKNPLQISDASITFNTQNVTLNNFEAKTGQTDLSAKGAIDNLLGYVFNKEVLKGNFTLNSNTFAVNDFMMTETSSSDTETPSEEKSSEEKSSKTETTNEEQIKIPSFLDATIVAKANEVLYDNLTLKNVSGTLIVKDETVTLKDLKSNIFGGEIAVNGAVSTKNTTPTFNVALAMQRFNISESFQGLEMLQAITPIANALEGVLNSNFSIEGNLNNDFTPNLNSISGNALAEAIVSGFNPEKGKVLSMLSSRLNFLNLQEGETKDIKTTLTFKDGKVNVKPFNLKYKEINVQVAGSHGFDKSIDYNATFDVPAKYLGDDVLALLAKLNDPDAENITVPVSATIGGTYSNPSISTNLSTTATELTKKLVEMQKDKLLSQGSDKVKDVIGGLLGGNKTEGATNASQTQTTQKTDSVTTDKIKNAADNLIQGLFGKKKDTSKTN